MDEQELISRVLKLEDAVRVLIRVVQRLNKECPPKSIHYEPCQFCHRKREEDHKGHCEFTALEGILESFSPETRRRKK